MRPIYSISSVYRKNNNFESSELQDLCAALDQIYSWGVINDYKLSCWFSDPERTKEKERLLTDILINEKFINKFKRLIRGEKYDGSSALKNIIELDKDIAIKNSNCDGDDEFSRKALKALEANSQSNYTAMGGSPTNNLTIMFKPNLQGFSLWLNLYRFEDFGLQLELLLSSMEAYEDSKLQK